MLNTVETLGLPYLTFNKPILIIIRVILITASSSNRGFVIAVTLEYVYSHCSNHKFSSCLRYLINKYFRVDR